MPACLTSLHIYKYKTEICIVRSNLKKNIISVSNATIIHSKQQSSNIGIVIGRIRLLVKRPIIGRYRLSADYRCIHI